LPVVIFGGTAPLVCAYLLEVTQLLTAPALYIVAIGVIALPVAYRLAFPDGYPSPSTGELDSRGKLSRLKSEES